MLLHIWEFFSLIPYLNKLIKSLDKRQATYLIIIVLLLFSVGDMFAKIFFGEFTYLEDGYNAFWLAILYLVGAYIRKYNISAKITRKRALLGFITMAGITWLIKLFADLFTHRFADLEWGSRISNAVIDYTSPFIFFEAVFLFVLFANWQVQNRTCKKMICFFAPISFGVYLINTNNYVFDILLPGAFSSYLQFSLIAFIPVILLTVFLQYIVLALIEKGRLLLFQRCRLNEIIRKADWLPQWVESKWDKRKISQ